MGAKIYLIVGLTPILDSFRPLTEVVVCWLLFLTKIPKMPSVNHYPLFPSSSHPNRPHLPSATTNPSTLSVSLFISIKYIHYTDPLHLYIRIYILFDWWCALCISYIHIFLSIQMCVFYLNLDLVYELYIYLICICNTFD